MRGKRAKQLRKMARQRSQALSMGKETYYKYAKKEYKIGYRNYDNY